MTDENNKATTPPGGQVLDAATLESVKRHIAGATVTHSSPFKDLPVPRRSEELSRKFNDHWVVPLYLTLRHAWYDPLLHSLWPEMNRDVAYALLAETNWRPRCVGACIVAVRQLHELTDDVGRLLLRSDVCFVGHNYCLALAQLNRPQARRYLHEYLDYYLSRPDLRFDQASAMGAVAFLDQVNGTHDLDSYLSRWQSFVSDNPALNLEQSCSGFTQAMERIRTFIATHA